MCFYESGMLNLYAKMVLFRKVATLDETNIFSNTFTKCYIVSPTSTLFNVALFRIQQHFYQMFHYFAYNNNFQRLHCFTFYNTLRSVAYSRIQTYCNSSLVLLISEFKPTTYHKCCLFLN